MKGLKVEAKTVFEIKGKKPRVKLVGKDGNAFVVMGLCGKALKKAGYSVLQLAEFYKECQAGDYDHLLQTAMKWCDVR